ncbi:IS701 family transposase [Kineosporia mesophila]|uniref:IS701 family transposase n=1 Tax=Kineosporia mesophila TaxID=566012 RepID=A0ABP6YUZ2_9ACTN
MHDPAYERSLKVVYDRIAHNFSRAEPRKRAWNYLVDLPRAHTAGLRRGETVGHYSGEIRADGVQRLLTSARWDEFSVREELRAIAIQAGGRTGGTLFLTEIAFPKKGRNAVAVERQYSHDTQRVENCQIGLLLFYLTADRQAFLIDSELYLPPSWVSDPQRREQAQIPPEVVYRSKSAIAAEMIRRAWESSIRPVWVACNLVCTEKNILHRLLRRYGVQHLVAGSAGEMQAGGVGRAITDESSQPNGTTPMPPGHEMLQLRNTVLHRFSTRSSDPSRIEMSYLMLSGTSRNARARSYYTAYLRPHAGLAEVVPIVQLIEGAAAHCRAVKQKTGLGHYEVRSWRGWYRHVTLASAAQMALELARHDNSADLRPQYVDLRDVAYAAGGKGQAV